MSEMPTKGCPTPVDAVRVVVWSPYKPLENELRRLISSQAGIEALYPPYVGQLVREIIEADPDIAVLNSDCSAYGIADLIRRVRRAAPAIRIIALSAHRDQRIIARAFEAGAIAYVLTDCAFEDVPHALAAAARNERYVSPAIEWADASGPPGRQPDRKRGPP